MEDTIIFNYIITIHNKESLIRDVIQGVLKCCRHNSHIYAVLDGCTDRTEAEIDKIIEERKLHNITKLYAPDVHELKSINIGLRSANQEGLGFNIVLQDDVVLCDFDMEKKCIKLYSTIEKLGLVSFRHGGNISRALYRKKQSILPIIKLIENECGHRPNHFTTLKTGMFSFREIVIKSPICIPSYIVREFGCPDESYAPWDDLDYCYKIIKSGIRNGVFALDFKSDIEWGTTRKKIQKVPISEVQLKNLNLFKSRNKEIIPLDTKTYNSRVYPIINSEKKNKLNLPKVTIDFARYIISLTKLKLKEIIIK